MTEALLENKLWNWSAISSWELVEKLSDPETIPFEKLKKYIDNLSMDQLQDFLEDLIYVKEISLTKKAMSFKILNMDYKRDLFLGKKGNGIQILMMYYSKLSSGAGYVDWVKARVWEIVDDKKPTQYMKEEVENILFNKPFTMGGTEISDICIVLWIE